MEVEMADGTPKSGSPRSPSKTLSRSRSLSDVGPPTLSPSPKIFRSPQKPQSKDDSNLNGDPSTPRRPTFNRGLSLQMPLKELMSSPSASTTRIPLSPQLDQPQTYGSPTSVLPRRSRGLDFSRAATNLHHSILAEQSSPDSSPTTGGRGMNIPYRKNGLGGSDSMNSSSLWSTMASSDRMTVSSSLGSVNLMASDSSGSSSGDDDSMDADDIDDSILTTPQVSRMTTPFGAINAQSPGGAWSAQPTAMSGLMNFQRARLHKHKRKGTNNSGSSSRASPPSRSPPARRNESQAIGSFGKDMARDRPQSRRESISWAANQLHISGSESDDGVLRNTLENADGLPVTPGRDGQRGVIRRAVTRRGNMLPKTKNFSRIRAALAEESAPVETEVRREAEVVRQTRESDMDLEPMRHPSVSTAHSSPSLGPVNQESLGGIPEDDVMADVSNSLASFNQQAIQNSNSKGKDFWDRFSDDGKNNTPTPPLFLPGARTSMSEDFSAEDASVIFQPSFVPDIPPPSTPSNIPTAAEITTKVNNKRRRDDDFDPTSFKRRAVSPAMSVHNSPVMQSPMQRESAPWGSRPPSNGEPGKQNGAATKRVGFQGMVDTNDGLMKMSIE